MVCLRNICVNILHKGDSIFTNNNNNNNNNEATFLREIIFCTLIFFIHHGCAVMFLVFRGVTAGEGGAAAPDSRVQRTERWENEYFKLKIFFCTHELQQLSHTTAN
jgi:hypothetical protein